MNGLKLKAQLTGNEDVIFVCVIFCLFFDVLVRLVPKQIVLKSLNFLMTYTVTKYKQLSRCKTSHEIFL